MAMIAEYALIPDVFDASSYSSEEVCGLHLQSLKEVLLHEGLVRDLHDGAWLKAFDVTTRTWHGHGKELLRKLSVQKRLVRSSAARQSTPQTDAEWCLEALASHTRLPLAGIISTDAIAKQHKADPSVCAVKRLTSATWWANRSCSVRLSRTLTAYRTVLDPILRHANSMMFIDPYINPDDVHQYSDLLQLLASLKSRSPKPLVEVHRAVWDGPGNDKRPRIKEVTAALTPRLQAVARAAGISVDVFLWDDIHDRFLITDLVGISLPYGFGTTRAPNSFTTWSRLGRADRDSAQRDFDPNYRKPHHRFRVS